ncbi:MAG: antibiotic biosynthesis monooxygenase [Bdellovibrionales bacterium]|nr:antibiotic biosynthesis monooxygenase [Bdellovibrionales bacterium]
MSKVSVINIFTVKNGKLDEFIDLQQRFASELSKNFDGLIGGRMFKGLDGKTAVLVSVFASMEQQEAVRKLPMFQTHIEHLRTLIDEAKPALFEIAYTVGEFV